MHWTVKTWEGQFCTALFDIVIYLLLYLYDYEPSKPWFNYLLMSVARCWRQFTLGYFLGFSSCSCWPHLPTLESIKISFSWTQDVWCAPAGLHWLITSSHLNCSYSTLTAVHCCQYGINIIRRKRKPTVKFDYLLMNRELTNKWWENNESLIWQWHHLTSSASITTPDTDHQSWELVRICPSSGVWSRPPDESHCAVNQSTFHNQTFQTYLTLS